MQLLHFKPICNDSEISPQLLPLRGSPKGVRGQNPFTPKYPQDFPSYRTAKKFCSQWIYFACKWCVITAITQCAPAARCFELQMKCWAPAAPRLEHGRSDVCVIKLQCWLTAWLECPAPTCSTGPPICTHASHKLSKFFA